LAPGSPRRTEHFAETASGIPPIVKKSSKVNLAHVRMAILIPREGPGITARVQSNRSVVALGRNGTKAWRAPQRGEVCLVSEALSESEVQELNDYEHIIGNGWNAFLEVGHALSEIRQKRLYRGHYQTFEEYCRRKWDFSKTHANRLIEAAAVADILTPIGVKLRSESHVRALVWLPPQQIVAAWKRAEALAGKREVTAKLVREAVREIAGGFAPDPKRLPERKSGLSRAVLHGALKLIDKAEKAARTNNTQDVLSALAELRRCLAEM
jgi:hypothetical protein